MKREPGLSTFSIVGHDPGAQEWGIAVQSKFLAVGAVVPWARAGVGAVATQSYANTAFGPEGLALMARGLTAEETLGQLVAGDELSRCTPEILTPESVRRIVTLCATHPHWKREEVYQHLQGQNVSVSRRQARQAMERGAPPRWTSLRLGIQHLAASGPGAAGQ